MAEDSLTPEQVAKRGEQIYAEKIRDQTTPEDDGKFCIIDVTTGDYAIDEEDLDASLQLLANGSLGENLYGLKIGCKTAYRFGGHRLVEHR